MSRLAASDCSHLCPDALFSCNSLKAVTKREIAVTRALLHIRYIKISENLFCRSCLLQKTTHVQKVAKVKGSHRSHVMPNTGQPQPLWDDSDSCMKKSGPGDVKSCVTNVPANYVVAATAQSRPATLETPGLLVLVIAKTPQRFQEFRFGARW